MSDNKTTKKPYFAISSWSLGDKCTFLERCKAASLAGFNAIGLRAETFVDALNEGLSQENLLEILEMHNLKVVEVEYITAFADDIRSYEQKYKEQICFMMCKLFNVNHINCGLMEKYDNEIIAKRLDELAIRAKDKIIGIEPMPYSGVVDIFEAGKIMKLVTQKNIGVIIDSWHFARANSKISLDTLKAVDATKIISIQINDVQARAYAKSVLRDESMHDRAVIGQGVFDTYKLVSLLKDYGVKPKVIGVEVISDSLLDIGLNQAAKLLYESSIDVYSLFS